MAFVGYLVVPDVDVLTGFRPVASKAASIARDGLQLADPEVNLLQKQVIGPKKARTNIGRVLVYKGK